jgi:membrane protein DedA with SNARE-associated domain
MTRPPFLFMHDLLAKLIAWYQHSLEAGGYPLIILLMFIESTFLPLPSELIIPFAAHLAHTKGGMTLPGIVVAGTFGCWLGATAMYWASRWAGRPLVIRISESLAAWSERHIRSPFLRRALGHILVSPEKIEKAENWAAHYGNFGIFASRLLPVVRHLIGIPAGIVKMNFGWFSLYTILGSALWCGVLCWLGVKAGEDPALMNGELHAITLWAVGLLAVLGVIYYFFVHRHMRAAKK